MSRSLGVVIPAYRPAVDALAAYVRGVAAALDPETIRIELDAPDPGVVDRLESLPATVATVGERRGKGAAITHGFEHLGTDVLAFADADGSTPADSLGDVVAPVIEGTADLAAGSRRHPDAEVRSHQTYVRRTLGHAFAFLARRLLSVPLFDYQCGAKAIDREAWRAVRGHLYEPGFAWDLELLAMAGALGHRIEEVPIAWEDHPDSTVDTVGTSVALARALFAVRHRAKLLGDSHLHAAIDTKRGDRVPLIERHGVGDD
ncbi:MAG: glycosyltransferase [Halobacteriales archaeon]